MLKAGGLYRNLDYDQPVWLNTAPHDFSKASLLDVGDLFVLLNSDSCGAGDNYWEILVSKDGKRGFISRLDQKIEDGEVEEVKEVEE
jgi:hypothetical protein